jgi:hypothetical protein
MWVTSIVNLSLAYHFRRLLNPELPGLIQQLLNELDSSLLKSALLLHCIEAPLATNQIGVHSLTGSIGLETNSHPPESRVRKTSSRQPRTSSSPRTILLFQICVLLYLSVSRHDGAPR